MSDSRDLVDSDLIVQALAAHDRQPVARGKAVAYSVVPQYCIETPSGRKVWWREDLVEVAPAEVQKQFEPVTAWRSVEETPEQVTLDELLPVDYSDPFPLVDDYEPVKAELFSWCVRCGGLIGNEYQHHQQHRRWHAAIEDLTVTVSAESASNFFDSSPPVITFKGSHALGTRVTPEQRRELVVALGLDPYRAHDCTWPAIIARAKTVRQIYTSGPVDDLGLPLETDQCGRHRKFIDEIWQIALEAGHQNGASVTDFLRDRLQRTADLLAPETAGERGWNREFIGKVREIAREAGYNGGQSTLDWLRAQLVELAERRATADTSAQTDQPDPDLPRTAEALAGVINSVRRELGEALMMPPSATFAEMVEQAELIMLDKKRCREDHTGLWRGDAQAEQPAGAEPCPSLYLYRDGDTTVLFACALGPNQHPQGGAYHANEDSLIVWQETEAVPSPWPVDREPPAGINVLRDTGRDGMAYPYLVRVPDGWSWADTPNPGYLVGTPWGPNTLGAEGDLVVVRP